MSKPSSRWARDVLKRLDADQRLPKLPPDIRQRLSDKLNSPEMQAKVKAVENSKALYAEVLAREKKAAAPIPMLQDWRCQGCSSNGTITVGSRDRLSVTLQSISLIHHAQSRTCHEQNETRRIIVGEPRLKDWPPQIRGKNEQLRKGS